MSEIKSGYKYTEKDDWVKIEGDKIRVGITDHAQHELTELVFVELPPVGKHLKKGEVLAVVESVKAASDVLCPADGEVVEVNTQLSNDPGLINRDPYGEGWIAVLKISNPAQLTDLLDEKGYKKKLGK